MLCYLPFANFNNFSDTELNENIYWNTRTYQWHLKNEIFHLFGKKFDCNSQVVQQHSWKVTLFSSTEAFPLSEMATMPSYAAKVWAGLKIASWLLHVFNANTCQHKLFGYGVRSDFGWFGPIQVHRNGKRNIWREKHNFILFSNCMELSLSLSHHFS